MNFKKTLAAFLSASILVCPATQAQSVILTSDQQLHDITDPDRIVDLSVGNEPFRKSFRQVCEWGKSMGSTQLIVAFDEFFRQYRMQVGTERRLTPDMDEYIGEMKKVSDFFIDRKLSRFDKERCWLLLSGNDIVWIVGLRTDDRFKVTPRTRHVLEIAIEPES